LLVNRYGRVKAFDEDQFPETLQYGWYS
jgi:hypothetical protein